MILLAAYYTFTYTSFRELLFLVYNYFFNIIILFFFQTGILESRIIYTYCIIMTATF